MRTNLCGQCKAFEENVVNNIVYIVLIIINENGTNMYLQRMNRFKHASLIESLPCTRFIQHSKQIQSI